MKFVIVRICLSNSYVLHHFPASRSARVKWALLETVGDNFEEVIVPLYEGGQFHPQFNDLNPNHAVPVLEIEFDSGDTKCMLESAAIIEFLADGYPEAQLAPSAGALDMARSDYLQMLHFGSTWIDMMLWQIRIHEHLLAERDKDERTATRYREKFTREVEPQLVERLSQTSFICGDSFTAADIVIGHDVMWAKRYELCSDSVFRRYLARLLKRPACKAAFADAGEFTPVLPERVREAGRFKG